MGGTGLRPRAVPRPATASCEVSSLDCYLYIIVISKSVKINQSFNMTEILEIILALIIVPGGVVSV